MANNFTSNQRDKIAEGVLDGFENSIVLLKNVTTPETPPGNMANTGDTTYVDRPQRSKSVETADGDLTAQTADDIVRGKAAVTRQNYITVYKSMKDVDKALVAGDKPFEKLMKSIGTEIATKAETNFGKFAIDNAGLTYGTPGQPLNNWNELAGAAALMKSIGANVNESGYFMNAFAQANLAGVQNGLNASDGLVKSAWENSTISNNVGGIRALTSTSLKNYQAGATTDRVGTLGATPTATYVAAKDSMTQSITLSGLTASVTDAVRAGDVIEYTGSGASARSFVNINTRETIMGADGLPVKFRQTVVTGGDTDGSGDVTVTVTSPAIYETAAGAGAYNNVSAALVSGDAFTILGALDTFYQPSLFFEREAFMYATVDLPTLKDHVTTVMSESGMVIRVTLADNAISNQHILRADMLPAIGVMEPLKAGKGFGLA